MDGNAFQRDDSADHRKPHCRSSGRILLLPILPMLALVGIPEKFETASIQVGVDVK